MLPSRYPSFYPGGFLYAPTPSKIEKLYAQVAPLHSIYVSSERTGAFIVDASLSYVHGSPYAKPKIPFPEVLRCTISVDGLNHVLVTEALTVGTTDNVFSFDFDARVLKPQTDAYDITLTLTSFDGRQKYTAKTQLFYLPDKTTGSVTKINNLYGGMLFKNAKTNNEFVPLLPFGFYADYSGWENVNTSNIKEYHDMGLNAIHPVTEYDGSETWSYMDSINLLWQYDMRGSYQNSTSVAEQVTAVKDHSGLFAYYTGDEPDGWEYALNSTSIAYEVIASIDKYHPIGLALNCQNYYFEEYSAGADFLMEDAYPVGINAVYSKWGTPCNTTYGDCGCDNCHGSLTDVSDRLDDFATYQSWLGQWPKPRWAVQQAFDGEGYWSRDPTAAESWVMNQLAFNHGGTAIMSWIYPTTPVIADAYSKQAKVVTVAPVVDFLLSAHAQRVSVQGFESLDVATWTLGRQILVSVVNTVNASTPAVEIPLPAWTKRVNSQPWGDLRYAMRGNVLQVEGVGALATSFVILDSY